MAKDFILPPYFDNYSISDFLNSIFFNIEKKNKLISIEKQHLLTFIKKAATFSHLPNSEEYFKRILYTVLCLIKLNNINDVAFPFGVSKLGEPTGGYEFKINRSIYHLHVTQQNDIIVLLWYLTKPNENENEYFIKIKYATPHPGHDRYEIILNDIEKNDEDAYHIDKKGYIYSTLYENKIDNFKTFLSKK